MEPLVRELAVLAALIALTHTALGPDHTLPFVMLGRARRWSFARTLGVTAACGIAHVGASLLLVGAALAAGSALARLAVFGEAAERLDGLRGDLAGWGLVAAGLAYALWGVRRALRRRVGLAAHRHGDHVHIHRGGAGEHRHDEVRESRGTFWMLFALFVLGPCEPLIALFLPLAATGRWTVMLGVGAVFSLVTVGTMLVLVGLGHAGLARLPLGPLETWSHTLAGIVIAGSGAAVLFLGF